MDTSIPSCANYFAIIKTAFTGPIPFEIKGKPIGLASVTILGRSLNIVPSVSFCFEIAFLLHST
jgi:hypothetical protein